MTITVIITVVSRRWQTCVAYSDQNRNTQNTQDYTNNEARYGLHHFSITSGAGVRLYFSSFDANK